MSKKTDSDNLIDDNSPDGDEYDYAQTKQSNDPSIIERFDHENLTVPTFKEFSICQWIIIVTLYLVFAFLAGFIIYISSTWNKDRTNEYT